METENTRNRNSEDKGENISRQGSDRKHINPYEIIAADMYGKAIGKIVRDEDGIVTDAAGPSGVVYSGLDFGNFGSDEITVPIEVASEIPCLIEIWKGIPHSEDGRLLEKVTCQSLGDSGYQEVKWVLPRKIRGVADLGFLFYGKLKIKEFSFRKYNKAISRVYAAEADTGSGDMFRVGERAVTDFGDNVTLEYDNMDFGQEGVSGVRVGGSTPLDMDTLRFQFVQEDGQIQRREIRFKGQTGDLIQTGFNWQEFSIEPLTGKGKIQFSFVQGCKMDFEGFEFFR